MNISHSISDPNTHPNPNCPLIELSYLTQPCIVSLAHLHDRQLYTSEYPKITLFKCSGRYPLSLKLELKN